MRRVLCAVVVSLTVLAGAASAAWAAPAAPTAAGKASAGCWQAAETLHYPTDDQPRWTYTHHVEWCGDGTAVTWWNTPEPDIDVADDACASQGVQDRWQTPGTPGWATHSMGQLSCRDEAEPYQLNPWVTVTVYPDGRYEVEKDIAGYPYA